MFPKVTGLHTKTNISPRIEEHALRAALLEHALLGDALRPWEERGAFAHQRQPTPADATQIAEDLAEDLLKLSQGR